MTAAANAEIWRDAWGIPHIRAGSAADIDAALAATKDAFAAVARRG
jgi:acyl-homoserine lactone acylase PvdQ